MTRNDSRTRPKPTRYSPLRWQPVHHPHIAPHKRGCRRQATRLTNMGRAEIIGAVIVGHEEAEAKGAN
jgi:hypothetical protein